MPDANDHGAAQRLHDLLVRLFGAAPEATLETWDGARAGTDDRVVVRMNSRRGVRRLLWAPGDRGVVQAYVLGELDVRGDFARAVALLHDYADFVGPKRTLDPAGRREVLRTTVLLGAVGPAPRSPGFALDAVGGYSPVGLQMQDVLDRPLAADVFGETGPDLERSVLESSDPQVEQYFVTSLEPLSALVRSWEEAGIALVGVGLISDEFASTLSSWAEGIEREWDRIVRTVGEQQARLWRVSLALDIEGFRRERIRAYRVTGRR